MRPSHHHHDKTWFVIPHVIPDYFGAGIFEFLGFYMNMWEIFFSILFLTTVQKPDFEFRVVINFLAEVQFTAFPNLLLL